MQIKKPYYEMILRLILEEMNLLQDFNDFSICVQVRSILLISDLN